MHHTLKWVLFGILVIGAITAAVNLIPMVAERGTILATILGGLSGGVIGATALKLGRRLKAQPKRFSNCMWLIKVGDTVVDGPFGSWKDAYDALAQNQGPQ